MSFAAQFLRKRILRVGGMVVAISMAPELISVRGAELAAQPAPKPAAAVPTAPPFEPPHLQPSLLDFLTGKPVAECCKLLATDPLLRPPFAGAPLSDPKGLASKIRGEQLDAKKRIRAVRYLGTVDCVAYPEASEKLVEVMHNDKYEPVRYEAALALGNMMSRGKSSRDQRRVRRGRARRFDTCRGCCNEKVLRALAKTAYDYDDFGCPFEPSKRVRDAALQAISACGCDECQMNAVPAAPAVPLQPAPPVKEQAPTERKEAPPTNKEERPPAPNTTDAGGPDVSSTATPAAGSPAPATPAASSPTSAALTPIQQAGAPQAGSQAAVAPAEGLATADVSEPPRIAALNGYCIVSLKLQHFVKADPNLRCTYRNRLYCFATPEAKAEFERDPERFAVRYSGADPVHFMKTGEVAEGQFLREFNDQLYLFVTKSNWETFKSHPEEYIADEDSGKSGAVRPASGTRN